MKKLLSLLISLSLGSFTISAQAENLLQVYQQARSNNPELFKSAADRDVAYEKINYSRGSLLPFLGLSGSYTFNRGFRGSDDDIGSNAKRGGVSLKQSIFNMGNWYQLSIAEQNAAIADITYNLNEQSLMLNSATAYFNVLRAIDALSQISAQKSAIGEQLEQTKQRFNVGLVAITDVHNAQAEYDNTLAQEVVAKNNLDNATEALREITGVTYDQLNSLDTKRFKMIKSPEINGLLTQAEHSNLSLISARLNQEMAKKNIKLARSGHMPTLSLDASASVGDTDQKGSKNPKRDTTNKSGSRSIGLTLDIPIFAGGQTSSQVKQAQYSYVGASQQTEGAYRLMVKNVRSSHNNIAASISTVRAYSQSVVSAESSLKATNAGYSVGTRTIVDVLNATTSLYSARTNLSNARYDYLINQLNLKYSLGTLSENDIAQLNGDLGKPISTAVSLMPN